MFNFTPFFAGFPSRALHRRIIYPGLSTWLSNLSAWKKNCCIIASNIRSISSPGPPLSHRSIGRRSIQQSAFRKSFAGSIGWPRSLCCWPTVRPLRSIWSFGSSRIRCMSNSAIRPMSNAVFWSAKRIARDLPRHYFTSWTRRTNNDFYSNFLYPPGYSES